MRSTSAIEPKLDNANNAPAADKTRLSATRQPDRRDISEQSFRNPVERDLARQQKERTAPVNQLLAPIGESSSRELSSENRFPFSAIAMIFVAHCYTMTIWAAALQKRALHRRRAQTIENETARMNDEDLIRDINRMFSNYIK